MTRNCSITPQKDLMRSLFRIRLERTQGCRCGLFSLCALFLFLIPAQESAFATNCIEGAPLFRAFKDVGSKGKKGPVFMGSTESYLNKSLLSIPLSNGLPSGIHIGVSGWMNYDIAARVNAAAILVIDINPAMKEFHKRSIQLMCEHETREEFCRAAIVSFPLFLEKNDVYIASDHDGKAKPIPYKRSDTTSMRRALVHLLDFERDRISSWLGSSRSYTYIRDLALQGRIVAITADFCDIEALRSIADILQKSMPLETKSIYISNIAEWISVPKRMPMRRRLLDAFEESIHILGRGNKEAWVIDSIRQKGILYQRVSRLEHLKSILSTSP